MVSEADGLGKRVGEEVSADGGNLHRRNRLPGGGW